MPQRAASDACPLHGSAVLLSCLPHGCFPDGRCPYLAPNTETLPQAGSTIPGKTVQTGAKRRDMGHDMDGRRSPHTNATRRRIVVMPGTTVPRPNEGVGITVTEQAASTNTGNTDVGSGTADASKNTAASNQVGSQQTTGVLSLIHI